MDQQTQTPNSQPGAPKGGNFMQQLENFFDTYLHKKAPFQLPPSAKEFIVHYGPWITLVLMVIAIPVILGALGLAAVFAPTAAVYGGYRSSFMISSLFSLAAFVLEAAALPGLFKRSMHGWRLVYYSSLVTAVGELISFNIVSLIIGLAISMYFLFQIKEYYK